MRDGSIHVLERARCKSLDALQAAHLSPYSVERDAKKNTSEKNIELRKNMRVAVVLVVLFHKAFASRV